MAYAIERIQPWWTPEAREEAYEYIGEGPSCSNYEGPCGGCPSCLSAQVAYHYDKGFHEPTLRAAEHGLKFWPILQLDFVLEDRLGTGLSYPEFHEVYLPAPHIFHATECNPPRR